MDLQSGLAVKPSGHRQASVCRITPCVRPTPLGCRASASPVSRPRSARNFGGPAPMSLLKFSPTLTSGTNCCASWIFTNETGRATRSVSILRAPIFYAWHVAGWTCAGHGCDFRRVKDAPYGSLSGGNARRERSIIATEAKAKDDLDGLLVEIRRAPPHLFNSLCASRLVRSTNSLSSRIVQPTGCGAIYESAIYFFRKTHDVL